MSEIIVLDTHIWIWYINQNFSLFPNHWVEQIQTVDRVGVSPTSCYEIALAHNKGRLELNMPINEWFEEALISARIELLPLTPAIALNAVHLSPIHKDPFDRLIIATSLVYNAQLASIDTLFRQYPELNNILMQ